MPQPCSICTHANRREIDELVVSGEPNRRIAARYGVSEAAIRRHKSSHLTQALAKAEAREFQRADSLLDQVNAAQDRLASLLEIAEALLQQALRAADLKAAIASIRAISGVMREMRGYLELKGTASGELGQHAEVAGQCVIVIPERVPVGYREPLYPPEQFPEGRKLLGPPGEDNGNGAGG